MFASNVIVFSQRFIINLNMMLHISTPNEKKQRKKKTTSILWNHCSNFMRVEETNCFNVNALESRETHTEPLVHNFTLV